MKDMRVTIKCERCGKEFKCSPSHAKRGRIFCSAECSHPRGGRNNTGRTLFKKGCIPWNKSKRYVNPKQSKSLSNAWKEGKFIKKNCKHKLETKIKISAKQQGITAEDWKGFITLKDKIIRDQLRGKRGCYLEAHHIKRWADYPELRFELNNGVTLCRECHKLTRKIRR